MALKASVTFGAKRSVDYNSDNYSVTLEAEIADPTRAQEAIAGLFDEAREAVAMQIEEARGNVSRDGNGSNGGNGSSNGSKNNGHGDNGNGNGKPITEKQITFLTKLAKLKNIPLDQVLQDAGVDQVNDLTAKEASELIDNLKKERRRQNVNNRIANT